MSRMMKLVQKKRRGESEKLSSNGKVKQAKKSTGGGIQSGLRAFFSTGTKENTPPTSPEKGDSDIEIIEIDSDSGKDVKKRKKVFNCVELTKKSK
jgi:hypothetical protein